MMFMNGTISYAKMYSGEHSDMQMIAFPHAQFNSNLSREIDERDIVHIVNIA